MSRKETVSLFMQLHTRKRVICQYGLIEDAELRRATVEAFVPVALRGSIHQNVPLAGYSRHCLLGFADLERLSIRDISLRQFLQTQHRGERDQG